MDRQLWGGKINILSDDSQTESHQGLSVHQQYMICSHLQLYFDNIDGLQSKTTNMQPQVKSDWEIGALSLENGTGSM